MLALTEIQRSEIICLYKNNEPISKIAKILDIHRTTISRTIKKHIDGEGLATKQRSGHPKLINNENQKTLKKILKQNNRKSAEQIKNKFNKKTNSDVSAKTIRRTLHELNIFSRDPAAKPPLPFFLLV
jgi:transposase